MAPAGALEFWDDRVQIHGFGEMQVRALSKSFHEEFDVAQWYNVLNLEMEFDFAPDGFGPTDLFQAYVRAEVRYDCVWTRGCGLFPSVNTYGDRAHRLPRRLRDAMDADFSGSLKVGNSVPRIADKRPSPLAVDFVGVDGATRPQRVCLEFDAQGRCAPGMLIPAEVRQQRKRLGVPGFDTFFEEQGSDFVLGVDSQTGIDDDPGRYLFRRLLDHRFALIGNSGGTVAQTWMLAPWLPKNEIQANGLLADRANPFRGRTTPAGGTRFHEREPGHEADGDPLDPRLQAILDSDEVRPSGTPVSAFFPAGFGGDFSGLVACREPEHKPYDFSPAVWDRGASATTQIRGKEERRGCIPDGRPDPSSEPNPNFDPLTDSPADSNLLGLGSNVRITGGVGENPMRPAPDRSNLELFDPVVAQGIYYPSVGLRRELASGRLDEDLGFNYNELERSFNRGQSQQQTGELKEAYLDIEWLDSRLWTRIGLQNIVWGKTELFRTTDQFNPQDLALASLPALEESRIALWALRAVYSFYDVGPLSDVRAEVAFNFDEFQPNDLGACGEPYTIDVVCALTSGILFHSLFNVGVAGVDRPPAAWDDIEGIEIGGRIEWRWDRFSFALVDFWGYNDLPFPDRISTYERNVDPRTGRPRVAGSRGPCTGLSGPSWGSAVRNPNAFGSMTAAGVGRDPGCLKPGGAAGGPNENAFDPVLGPGAAPGTSPENALEYHHSNQSLFAAICLTTIGIAARLNDSAACAFSVFDSFEPLRPAVLPGGNPLTPPLSEIFSASFAGEPDGSSIRLLQLIFNNQTGSFPSSIPTAALNRDPRSFEIATNPNTGNPAVIFKGDGRITATDGIVNKGGFGPLQPLNNWLTLDSSLTSEQRALIGCGPFWGTRCDSSEQAFNVLGRIYARGPGGFDSLNAEASVLVQSWPGFEGTGLAGRNGYRRGPWTTTSQALHQPGTIGPLKGRRGGGGIGTFDGGPVCRRRVNGRETVLLPGCRGALSWETGADFVQVVFDRGYDPGVDGCVFAPNLVRRTPGQPPQVVPVVGVDRRGRPIDLSRCASSTSKFGDQNGSSTVLNQARTLYHPLAGCLPDELANLGGVGGIPCDFLTRDFDREFFEGTAYVFRNEMAAYSWNFLMFLVGSSCDARRRDIANDPECFNADTEIDPEADPRRPTNANGARVIFNAWRSDRCSFNAPHLCANVKGFFNATGTRRNVLVAGGNLGFGQRTFLWHGGGELVLRYDKRNVLGLSTDFAEDRTKTNWSMEFTWIAGVPFVNNDSFTNITRSDTYNLTISVDRPTFVNFLNANRTFFFNTQWFLQWVGGYERGFPTNGPWNVLFTFAVQTGYFQDRLLPNFVTVFDIQSESGGFLPQVTYRFTENFSGTVGANFFFGSSQLVDMPVNEFAPPSPRFGPDAHRDAVDNAVSLIRRRDEIFFRLRYTF